MLSHTGNLISCGCCGAGIENTPEANVHFGDGDEDGMCVKCGGDKNATGLDEAATRKRIGWAGEVFFDARIKILDEQLSPKNKASFAAKTYAQKVAIVTKMIEKGYMT